MNNKLSNKNIISLLELQTMIKEKLNVVFSANYQVVADINEIKENSSGHCYLELVEHGENSSIPKAKITAAIWSYTYRMLKPYFENETGTSLSAGMKISVTVRVQYHELYGLSLSIIDIDPSYTVGEMQLQRQRTVKRLMNDGVFDMNRYLQIPDLPLRIAIISSTTAAGYRDFINQLCSNDRNYNFQTTLFTAVMQGRDAEASIIACADEIYKTADSFDVIVIIRGGGSVSDLSCFDSYNLASCIAQIPVPVITGIGHDKDTSIVDMIANTSTKTPTAAAEFLINCVKQQEIYLNRIAEQFTDTLKVNLQNKHYELQNMTMKLKNTVSMKIEQNRYFINNFFTLRMKPVLAMYFKELRRKLYMYQTTVDLNNPAHILKRGYSIVTYNGKAVTDANALKINNEIKITLYKGNKTAVISSD